MLRSLLVVLALAQPLPSPTSTPEAPPAVRSAPVRYHRPLRAPLVDRFRLPDGPYGAGNRGWEYTPTPGATVRAAAEGSVAFAGPVAGELYVTLVHTDGIRSSYGYLTEISVAVGQWVRSGDRLGSAGPRFQIGFRRGETYLDPATLFGPVRVRLVPDDRLRGGWVRPG